MKRGSAVPVLRNVGLLAARNAVRVVAACLATSVLCIIIFLAVGAEPHSSIVLLDLIGVIGIFTLSLGIFFALLNKMGLWWSVGIAITVCVAVIIIPAFL